MTSKRSDFKSSQVFGWESEPKDERPSEFHTTGFSSASGYHHGLDDAGRAARTRRTSRSVPVLVVALLIGLGVGTVAVLWLAQFLRG